MKQRGGFRVRKFQIAFVNFERLPFGAQTRQTAERGRGARGDYKMRLRRRVLNQQIKRLAKRGRMFHELEIIEDKNKISCRAFGELIHQRGAKGFGESLGIGARRKDGTQRAFKTAPLAFARGDEVRIKRDNVVVAARESVP
ncbi:MAG: hypothetical protein HDKAJFGB_02664 [Anaerolineae bacterium]|nr:hypothetical protein [Anaerolineae bacterium]